MGDFVCGWAGLLQAWQAWMSQAGGAGLLLCLLAWAAGPYKVVHLGSARACLQHLC